MANISIVLPDKLLTQLDHRAKRERRSRGELLCEAARRYLSQPEDASTQPSILASPRSAGRTQKWTSAKLTQYLLDKGVVTRGCLGLDGLLGPVSDPVDMERMLEIGKKLSGISQQIIDDREDRV